MKNPIGRVKTAIAANSISIEPAMNSADPTTKRTTLSNSSPICNSLLADCTEDEMASADVTQQPFVQVAIIDPANTALGNSVAPVGRHRQGSYLVYPCQDGYGRAAGGGREPDV